MWETPGADSLPSRDPSPVVDGFGSVGQLATLACLLEVSAPKPGNVHRGADFEDLTLNDFLVSATCIGPAMQAAAERGVGLTVRDAIHATRSCVGRNTNLGTVLLLAPLAAVPRGMVLADGVPGVLARLTAADAALVYQAILLAQPGGLGQSGELDVHGPPPASLLEAMRVAEDRDLVARQYTTNFATVLDQVVPWLVAGRSSGWSLTESIIYTHVRLMEAYPDSLIARKCGPEVARRAARMALAALDAGPPPNPDYYAAVADLDFWLRSDGNRRNPGTTADLIAAGLFAALRQRLLPPPWN
ncbi:MAG: triphosphoribosyl-dephospho-CoA synthase [Pirellulaceae bacterium]|nr:triphosphoribosyl-dephospho-CoA synthase [Pirellulaceae bacterium]